MLFPLKMCDGFWSSEWRIFKFFFPLWFVRWPLRKRYCSSIHRGWIFFSPQQTSKGDSLFFFPLSASTLHAPVRIERRIEATEGPSPSIWAGYNPDKNPLPIHAQLSRAERRCVGGERSGSGRKTGVRPGRRRARSFYVSQWLSVSSLVWTGEPFKHFSLVDDALVDFYSRDHSHQSCVWTILSGSCFFFH